MQINSHTRNHTGGNSFESGQTLFGERSISHSPYKDSPIRELRLSCHKVEVQVNYNSNQKRQDSSDKSHSRQMDENEKTESKKLFHNITYSPNVNKRRREDESGASYVVSDLLRISPYEHGESYKNGCNFTFMKSMCEEQST